MRSDEIALLRSPANGGPLAAHGSFLTGDSGERYPIVDGVPILLTNPDALAAATDARPAALEGEDGDVAIVRAFKRRSTTYYSANYASGGNPSRLRRQDLVETLVSRWFLEGGIALEAGSGPLVLAEAIRRHSARHVAVDLSPHNLREGERREGDAALCVCADLRQLPFADATFDSIAAIGCLEYIHPVELAISELCRVARPGGTIILTIANRASPARWWDEVMIHPISRMRARRAGRVAYRRRLTSLATVDARLRNGRARVVELHYVNQGIVGQPFSRSRTVVQLCAHLERRVHGIERLSSEIVLVVCRDIDVSPRHELRT